jgi:hypothetical protein
MSTVTKSGRKAARRPVRSRRLPPLRFENGMGNPIAATELGPRQAKAAHQLQKLIAMLPRIRDNETARREALDMFSNLRGRLLHVLDREHATRLVDAGLHPEHAEAAERVRTTLKSISGATVDLSRHVWPFDNPGDCFLSMHADAALRAVPAEEMASATAEKLRAIAAALTQAADKLAGPPTKAVKTDKSTRYAVVLTAKTTGTPLGLLVADCSRAHARGFLKHFNGRIRRTHPDRKAVAVPVV